MKAVKGRANQALLAAAALFVVSLVLVYIYPGNWWFRLLLTVAEASLAGGVADWFAVTALFRRPLGFPYHTALIPRNRERLIEGLVSAVEQDFLSKKSITARLMEAAIIKQGMAQSETSTFKPFIKQAADKLISGLVMSVNIDIAARYAERVIKFLLKHQPVAGHSGEAIRWFLEQGKGRQVYTAIIGELAIVARAEKTRDTIFLYLEQVKQKTAKKNWLSAMVTGFMESIDGINLSDAAEALQQELIKTVDELYEDDHPVWLWFEDQLAELIVKLEAPEWENAVNVWKDSLIIRISLYEPLTALIRVVVKELGAPSAYRHYLTVWLANKMESSWENFKQSPAMQSQAEAYIKTFLNKLINNEHHLVGTVARQALQKLSDEDLNRFIEEKAGEDLEWIRINGVLVGGLAGLGLVVLKTLL
ncbi:DUF445 domain-containing protein [Sporomusa termitida]|uniref:DUF445 domain-containing protein n=1 Tax=Sporomusa termitida TaxID=2377 RepID=A0A517DZU0_9FIRM|nr:DUF445 domain-containing protein [Sporomusa termitida]QDR82873.1 hypothetical protein SPTER_43140 [Sporomusa termitida]